MAQPVGQGQGVATDVDGAFTLNVANNVKQIQVSYVGFKTKTVNVGDYVLVTLESSDNTLDEVTITVAYGQSVVSVAGAVQDAVTNALESMAGVKINAVNVNVCGIVRQ